MNYNRVILAGNLTRDVEVRNTQSGQPVAKFGLAVNRKFKDQETTCFVDCVAWGKTGELVATYCGKGSQVLVEGRLEYSQWEDQQGNKRNKLEVVVENVQFGNKGGDAKPSRHESQKADGYQRGEDIPF